MKSRTQRIARFQGWNCYWCGLPMLDTEDIIAIQATLDHLEPKNGKFREAVAAHRACNNDRGHDEQPPAQTISKIHDILRSIGMLDAQNKIKKISKKRKKRKIKAKNICLTYQPFEILLTP